MWRVAELNKRGLLACRGQWFPDGLTQLALTDVSGSSGSLHEHSVRTDFLQKQGDRLSAHATPSPFHWQRGKPKASAIFMSVAHSLD